MPIVSIEGNIGAGKSTVLSALQDLGFIVVPEPTHRWPLDDFYRDPQNFALTFQTAVLATSHPSLFATHLGGAIDYAHGTELSEAAGLPCGLVFTERCPISQRQVFWRQLVDTGVVTSRETEIFSRVARALYWEPDLVIYLRTSAELCAHRVASRGQSGDQGVDLPLIQRLESYYDRVFDRTDPLTPCQSITLDTDLQPADITVNRILNIVSAFRDEFPAGQGTWY